MNPGASWIVTGATDRGRTRTRNEDSFAVVPEHGIAIVADGMGGHPGGDVASRVAVSALAAALVRGVSAPGPDDASNGTPPHGERAMRASVLEAHEAVRAESQAQPALAGMGTTATAVVLDPAGHGITVGHVGDSRCYRFRGGKLTQLTRDDTLLQQRMEAGEVRREDARGHPHGHMLTQCLGLAHPPEPRVLKDVVAPGDAILLCSDGLTACLSDEEVEAVLGRALDGTTHGAERAVTDLIREANAAGGVDNITVVVAVSGPTGAPRTLPRAAGTTG